MGPHLSTVLGRELEKGSIEQGIYGRAKRKGRVRIKIPMDGEVLKGWVILAMWAPAGKSDRKGGTMAQRFQLVQVKIPKNFQKAQKHVRNCN